MDQGHTDNFESPLDDVLDNLPQEQPPADLRDRCISALRTAEASGTAGSLAPAGRSWWSPLRTVAAVAASFLVVIGVASMISMHGGLFPAKSKGMEDMSGPPAAMMMKGGPDMAPPAPGEEKAPKPSPAYGVPGGMGGGGASRPTDGVTAAPASPPSGMRGPITTPAPAPASPPPPGATKGGMPSGGPGRPGSPPVTTMRMAEKPAPSSPAAAEMKRAEAPYSPPAAYPRNLPSGVAAGMPPAPPVSDHVSSESTSSRSERYRPGGETETSPWRDESGDRQRITSKRMELEVPKVEEAYDRAISIIEKADGHTTTEDLQIRDDGKNRGHIVARVPIDKFEGVMAQLRELGKVKLLTGEREDVTKEYNNRGSDIREAGGSEDELVAKYEKETDPARKRQLYSQIQELRNTNKQHKNALESLGEQTHYALLDLTLIEQAGPARFFSQTLENTGKLGLWLLATSVIWIPLLIVGYFLFRRSKQPGAG